VSQRFYQDENGKKYISVTSVLDQRSKPYLYPFYAKYGLAGANRVKEESQDIGTSFHAYVHGFFLDEPLKEVNKKAYNAINNFHIFYEKYTPEPILMEQTVFNYCCKSEDSCSIDCQAYAGTFDGLFIIKGKVVLVDWKTSNQLGNDVYYQLIAYYYALTNMVKLGKIILDKPIDCLWAVRFDKKKEFKPAKDIIKIKPDEKILSGYLALLKSFYADLYLNKLRRKRDRVRSK